MSAVSEDEASFVNTVLPKSVQIRQPVFDSPSPQEHEEAVEVVDTTIALLNKEDREMHIRKEFFEKGRRLKQIGTNPFVPDGTDREGIFEHPNQSLVVDQKWVESVRNPTDLLRLHLSKPI